MQMRPSPGCNAIRVARTKSVAISTCFVGLMAVATVLAAPAQTAPGAQGGRGPATPAPSATADGEFTIRPPWSSAPETIYDNNIPHGTIHRFTMKSTESKIYQGIARGQQGVVPYERPVAVYIPAQYVPGTPAPFIVVQDGFSAKYHCRRSDRARQADCREARAGHARGARAARRRRRPGQPARPRIRHRVRRPIATFIETEVLPRIERDYKVKFTDRSRRPGDHGRQFRRCRGVHDGLVSSRSSIGGC